MAISFNGNTLTGVAVGNTSLKSVYFNDSLVFDSWDTFSFPNGNNKMPDNDNKYLGFNATGSTMYTASYPHNKSFNGSDNDCYTASGISGTPYLFLKFPFVFGDSAIITSIEVASAENPDTTISYASEGKIYLITSGTDPEQNREEYSDFTIGTIGSTPKTFSPNSTAANIPCGGVVFTSKKYTRAKYGNITVNLKLPWSKLNAWKQYYNIS